MTSLEIPPCVGRISLTDPWFYHVRSGRKRYEGRRYHGAVRTWKVGDVLEVVLVRVEKVEGVPGVSLVRLGEPPFYVRITGIVTYANFEEALFTHAQDLEAVLPGVGSIGEGVEIYTRFVSLKTQEADGVCLIEMALL